MCPSYMATRDEAHSTRGRANILRLAMTGAARARPGLDDPGLHEALDLCLECRACKSECPVSVDMARIKSEVLAGQWARHGAPLRVKAFGHVRQAGPLGQPAGADRQCAGGQRAGSCPGRDDGGHRPPTRAAGVGPPHAVATDGGAAGAGGAARGAVRRHLHRARRSGDRRGGIGRCSTPPASATRLVPHGCCGRPLISQGLLEDARTRGRRHRRGAARRGGPRRGDRVRRAELPLGPARGRAGAAARRRAARAPATVAGPACSSRRTSRASWRRAAPSLPLRGGPRDGAAAPALSPAVDGPGRGGGGPAAAGFPARR